MRSSLLIPIFLITITACGTSTYENSRLSSTHDQTGVFDGEYALRLSQAADSKSYIFEACLTDSTGNIQEQGCIGALRDISGDDLVFSSQSLSDFTLSEQEELQLNQRHSSWQDYQNALRNSKIGKGAIVATAVGSPIATANLLAHINKNTWTPLRKDQKALLKAHKQLKHTTAQAAQELIDQSHTNESYKKILQGLEKISHDPDHQLKESTLKNRGSLYSDEFLDFFAVHTKQELQERGITALEALADPLSYRDTIPYEKALREFISQGRSLESIVHKVFLPDMIKKVKNVDIDNFLMLIFHISEHAHIIREINATYLLIDESLIKESLSPKATTEAIRKGLKKLTDTKTHKAKEARMHAKDSVLSDEFLDYFESQVKDKLPENTPPTRALNNPYLYEKTLPYKKIITGFTDQGYPITAIVHGDFIDGFLKTSEHFHTSFGDGSYVKNLSALEQALKNHPARTLKQLSRYGVIFGKVARYRLFAEKLFLPPLKDMPQVVQANKNVQYNQMQVVQNKRLLKSQLRDVGGFILAVGAVIFIVHKAFNYGKKEAIQEKDKVHSRHNELQKILAPSSTLLNPQADQKVQVDSVPQTLEMFSTWYRTQWKPQSETAFLQLYCLPTAVVQNGQREELCHKVESWAGY